MDAGRVARLHREIARLHAELADALDNMETEGSIEPAPHKPRRTRRARLPRRPEGPIDEIAAADARRTLKAYGFATRTR